MCDKHEMAITCMFGHDLPLNKCFLVFYKEMYLKEGEV